MSPELSQKIQTSFPFMKQNNVSEEKNIYRHWGFECSDGWYDLLNDCCKQIANRYDEEGIPVDLVPAQVKEKFGTLRFYYGYEDEPCGIAAFDDIGSGISFRKQYGCNSDEKTRKLRQDIAQIIRIAEERSACTCEKCGAEGTLRKIGYRVATYCDKCFESTLEKNNWR